MEAMQAIIEDSHGERKIGALADVVKLTAGEYTTKLREQGVKRPTEDEEYNSNF